MEKPGLPDKLRYADYISLDSRYIKNLSVVTEGFFVGLTPTLSTGGEREEHLFNYSSIFFNSFLYVCTNFLRWNYSPSYWKHGATANY